MRRADYGDGASAATEASSQDSCSTEKRVDEDENSFQAIIISLHPSFYGQADGLVGVLRDPSTTVSTTRTFSLEKFRRK